MLVIWAIREANYFCEQDWTDRNSLKAKEKFRFWRTLFPSSFRGAATAANPESRDSGSGPSDHPGMTGGSGEPGILQY
jgi:hypothetical protein